jgi:hypothetical protein
MLPQDLRYLFNQADPRCLKFEDYCAIIVVAVAFVHLVTA